MASRKEQKEAARQQRLAAQQEAASRAARTRRIQILGGAVVVALEDHALKEAVEEVMELEPEAVAICTLWVLACMAAFLALSCAPMKLGMATDARMPMMTTTTSSSINVKPC